MEKQSTSVGELQCHRLEWLLSTQILGSCALRVFFLANRFLFFNFSHGSGVDDSQFRNMERVFIHCTRREWERWLIFHLRHYVIDLYAACVQVLSSKLIKRLSCNFFVNYLVFVGYI